MCEVSSFDRWDSLRWIKPTWFPRPSSFHTHGVNIVNFNFQLYVGSLQSWSCKCIGRYNSKRWHKFGIEATLWHSWHESAQLFCRLSVQSPLFRLKSCEKDGHVVTPRTHMYGVERSSRQSCDNVKQERFYDHSFLECRAPHELDQLTFKLCSAKKCTLNRV